MTKIIMFILLLVPSLSFGEINPVDKGLLEAANKCDVKLVELMLSKGGNPNIFISEYGGQNQTALMVSISKYITYEKNKCLDTSTLLLKNGADPNLQDKMGNSAMFQAASLSRDKVLFDALINNGGNLNLQFFTKNSEFAPFIKNRNGRTFLIFLTNGDLALKIKSLSDNKHAKAKLDKYVSLYKYLASKTDVNMQDKMGRTALIYATQSSNHKIISILTSLGANTSIKDSTGKTALDYAIQNADSISIDILSN